jgi:hypothetical protein
MMDDVMLLQRGSTWQPTPCDEWSFRYNYKHGGEAVRHFKEGLIHDLSSEDWAWLGGAISCMCPQAQAAIGPLLIGPTLWLNGERLPGMILVALSNNRHPLETACHECMHEIWSRYLDEDEKGLLSDHANLLPGRAKPDQGEEAVCDAFGKWATGRPLGTTEGDVLALFQSIKSGDVGSRQSPAWE